MTRILHNVFNVCSRICSGKYSLMRNEDKRCVRTDDGKEFHVDSKTLTESSNYFKALFHYEIHQEILIGGIEGETMKEIINFIQKKSVKLNSGNVVALLRASDFLVLEEFSQNIISVLHEMICLDNCIPIYQLALDLNHLDVLKTAHTYLQIHFQSVVEKSNFENLPFEAFKKILTDEDLNVKEEETVWDAIVKWVESDNETRYKVVPLLLRCIRFETCSESTINKMIDHSVIQENEFCRSIVVRHKRSSNRNGNLKMSFIESIKELSSEPVHLGPRQLPQRMRCQVAYNLQDGELPPGKYDWGHGLTLVLMSSSDSRKNMLVAAIKNFVPKFMLIYGHEVYVFGDDGKIFSADLIRRTHFQLQHPFQFKKKLDRVLFSLVNGRIFAILTRRKTPAYITSAVFDLQSKEWHVRSSSLLTPVKVDIYWTEAAALKNQIYVAAVGTIHRSFTSFARVCNTRKDTWSIFDLPSTKSTLYKLFFTMVSFQGALYFIWSRNKSVYRYDPREGAWKSFQELPHFFDHPRAIVHNATLIVFDKDIGSSSPLFWDENVCKWRNNNPPVSVLACRINDADVLWKYHCEFLKKL